MLEQVERARSRGKNTKGTRRFRPPGFTLLELLVVTAAVAVVLAVLLPTLADARERARSATCSAQLRGLGIVVRQWTEDHRMLPAMYWRPQADEWQQLEVGDRAWTCPSAREYPGASTYRYVPGELSWSMRGPTQDDRMRQVLSCYGTLEDHTAYSGKVLYDWDGVHAGRRNVVRWSGWAGPLADPREVGTLP